MSNFMPEEKRAVFHSNVMHAAARMFLEKGYAHSSGREIAERAGVNISTMKKAFGHKENVLTELVAYVLEGQFASAKKLVAGKTDDPVLFYAAETALQLYMADSDAAVRELYATAYSLPGPSELIRKSVSAQLTSVVFRAYNPGYSAADFYELEAASGGVIRSYMLLDCTPDFPMEKKVRRFLEATLRIYRVPEEKLDEALRFIEQFDYPVIARQTIHDLLDYLEKRIE